MCQDEPDRLGDFALSDWSHNKYEGSLASVAACTSSLLALVLLSLTIWASIAFSASATIFFCARSLGMASSLSFSNWTASWSTRIILAGVPSTPPRLSFRFVSDVRNSYFRHFSSLHVHMYTHNANQVKSHTDTLVRSGLIPHAPSARGGAG